MINVRRKLKCNTSKKSIHGLSPVFLNFSNITCIRIHPGAQGSIDCQFFIHGIQAEVKLRIPYFELSKRLADYLEYLPDEPENEEETNNEKRARLYLDQWTDKGFLIKPPDNKSGEPLYRIECPY